WGAGIEEFVLLVPAREFRPGHFPRQLHELDSLSRGDARRADMPHDVFSHFGMVELRNAGWDLQRPAARQLPENLDDARVDLRLKSHCAVEKTGIRQHDAFLTGDCSRF